MDELDKPPAGEIYVVGLGPGDPLQLPALNLSLMRGRPVYLRTGRHPVVPWLEREGLQLQPLDSFYENCASFDEVYRGMAAWLIDAACRSPEPVVFAVPGHPLTGETVVGLLLARARSRGVRVRLWPAPGFLDAVLLSLGIDPAQGLVVTESFQLLQRSGQAFPGGEEPPSFRVPRPAGVLVAQVYSRALASEVKLTLMEHFPDDHPLTVVYSAGIRGQERQRQIPLYELDRLDDLDHLTSVYAPPLEAPLPDAALTDRQAPDDVGQEAPRDVPVAGTPMGTPTDDPTPGPAGKPTGVTTGSPVAPGAAGPAAGPVAAGAGAGGACQYPLDPLVAVMERLLSPGGCPWDREQTHQSLRKYLIEESYEVIDAIDEGNMNKLCEELGDLLLQVIFHAAIARRRGDFDINRVVAVVTAKLKRRHPHVFGGIRVNSAADVVRNWEAIKQTEGAAGPEARADERPRSLLAGVPRHLPSLQRAQKVQGKAALAGFDWPDAKSAAAKLAEEWQELQEAWSAGDEDAVRREMGDLLFAVVNVARLLQIDAEEALRAAVEKFMRRFRGIEAKAVDRGQDLRDLSLSELDAIWDEVKFEESSH